MLKVFHSDSLLKRSLAYVVVCVLGVTVSSGAIAGVSLFAISMALKAPASSAPPPAPTNADPAPRPAKAPPVRGALTP
ncbi:MAG: hypothetical protein JNL38_03085 [Myxococcales bacterium]|jgi:hypothetical protein|nr:hypothetical protein [Myxococcales bacterium]